MGLVGHTHRPLCIRLHGHQLAWNDQPQREKLGTDGPVLVNPGAVVRAKRWLELELADGVAVWHGE